MRTEVRGLFRTQANSDWHRIRCSSRHVVVSRVRGGGSFALLPLEPTQAALVMATIDWIIVCAYLFGMIALGFALSRGQSNEDDYYVGGRNLPWWAVGISVVATQSSAISFVSIPAFVALREGGGLTWLEYELAVPLAMILLMVLLVPYFRSLGLVSVFEFLRTRFGPGTARFLSVIFLVSRGFGTGVAVYATALVLAPMLGWSVGATIVLIGGATVIYDTVGGMRAIVVSDVIQLGLMVGGVFLCIYLAIDMAGGLSATWRAFEPARRVAVDLHTGVGDRSTAPFWAYLVGGFFLYASYYGTDQSQVQRLLATRGERETRLALILNGLSRLPLTLLYLALGVALAAAVGTSETLRAAVPANRIDQLVPQFILLYVPAGFKGLVLAAVLAAAMSSVDSAINALSAVTMRDYLDPWVGTNVRMRLWWSKATTVLWGGAVTAAAFAAGGISRTVVEAINKVGSAFYGPVLATFVLGVLSRSVGPRAMCAGVLLGVGGNLCCWLFDAPLHWMWWNALGFGVTTIGALGLSFLDQWEAQEGYVVSVIGVRQSLVRNRGAIAVLGLAFVIILGFVFSGGVHPE